MLRRLLNNPFLQGAVATLALPPIGAFYVLLFCVPAFIKTARAAETKKSAFLRGWAFGAGYFILGFYWISAALFVDLAHFWWVVPMALLLGPGLFGLYYGLMPLLAWRWRENENAYALIFVIAWGAVEWLRGHLFTGFPWNLPGYTWHMLPPLMQTSAYVGIYGLTLLTLLWAAIPVLKHKRALMVLFLVCGFGGLLRLHLNPAVETNVSVRLVQPNIEQTLKWDVQEERKNFFKLLDMTSKKADIVVWPETAVTADMQDYPAVAEAIRRRSNVALVGNLRTHNKVYHNSLAVLPGMQFYNKHHLVPFGEYIPYRNILNLTPIAASISILGDFTPGEGNATLDIGKGLPRISSLICYEAIFPGAVAQKDARPDLLVNVTNDAWYGKTAGPHQHFEIVRVRAVEEGLPLLRAANTGISAVIDPLGRIVAMKGLGESGTVDAKIPATLKPTVYARWGDLPFLLMLVLLCLPVVIRRVKP